MKMRLEKSDDCLAWGITLFQSRVFVLYTDSKQKTHIKHKSNERTFSTQTINFGETLKIIVWITERRHSQDKQIIAQLMIKGLLKSLSDAIASSKLIYFSTFDCQLYSPMEATVLSTGGYPVEKCISCRFKLGKGGTKLRPEALMDGV